MDSHKRGRSKPARPSVVPVEVAIQRRGEPSSASQPDLNRQRLLAVQPSPSRSLNRSSESLNITQPVPLFETAGAALRISPLALNNFLSDIPGHFVVTVVGTGAGRLAVANALSGKIEKCATEIGQCYSTEEGVVINEIDISERVALKDNRPDLWLKTLRLQLLMWSLLSNVVIIVMESHLDWEILDMLKTVDCLRSESITSVAATTAEADPEIIFVVHDAKEESLARPTLSQWKREISDYFVGHHRLQINTSKSMYTLLPNSETQSSPSESINLWVIPQITEVWVPFTRQVAFLELTRQIYDYPRSVSSLKVSEKEWFRNGMKTWELIRRDGLEGWNREMQEIL